MTVGVNHDKFNEAVRAFATELSIVNDKVTTDQERELARSYSTALDAYRDSEEVWRLKIEYPGTFDALVKTKEGLPFAMRQTRTQMTNLLQFGADEQNKYKRVPVEPQHDAILNKYSIPTEDMTNEVAAKSVGVSLKGADIERWKVFSMDAAFQQILAEAAKRLAKANAVYLGRQ
jgi:hypothetical protein